MRQGRGGFPRRAIRTPSLGERLEFSGKCVEEYNKIVFYRCGVKLLMGMRLFTVGYEGTDIQTFLDCLKGNAIECVLDVREVAFSRKRGFSKNPLSAALEANGIQYVHLKELGSPGAVRKELKASGDYGKFFDAVEHHLAIHREALERAYHYVEHTTCCLLCYEKLAAMCHRRVVARMIKERDGNGMEVKHLKVD